jgi:hypothetical protein
MILKTSDIRREFNVMVMREDIGFEIPICGLCGNSGIIDTRKSAMWNGKEVGIIGHCVCENGRAYKKSILHMSEKEMQEKLEIQKHQIFKRKT